MTAYNTTHRRAFEELRAATPNFTYHLTGIWPDGTFGVPEHNPHSRSNVFDAAAEMIGLGGVVRVIVVKHSISGMPLIVSDVTAIFYAERFPPTDDADTLGERTDAAHEARLGDDLMGDQE